MGLLLDLLELCWRLVTGIVLMQSFRDPLHLGVAQIAILFLLCLFSIPGKRTRVMVDSVADAEAGVDQRDGQISSSVSFHSGKQDVPHHKMMSMLP